MNLIKPRFVGSTLVAAIEQPLGENAELKAAHDLPFETHDPAFENSAPENELYMPMVGARVSYC